jgi:hypothetical protein
MRKSAALLTIVLAGTIVSAQSPAPQRPKGPAASASTPHLSVQATLSEPEAAPGSRVSITFAITPKAHMHVYAPGGKYRPVAVRFDAQPLLKIQDVVYPQAQSYHFEALNETVLVYSQPFNLTSDITLGETSAQQAQLRSMSRVTLKGTLDYQACDDEICYLPTSIPLQWTIRIKR